MESLGTIYLEVDGLKYRDYIWNLSSLGEGEMKDGNRRALSRADLTRALHKVKGRFAFRSGWTVGIDLAAAADSKERR